VGRQVGAFWRELVRHVHGPGAVEWLAGVAGLDAGAAEELVAYVTDQLSHSGCVPSDRCLVLESYVDQAGDYRVILHSPYGYRVHSAWEMAARQQVREETGLELVSVATDYGIAWHVPRGEEPPPLESLVYLGSDVEQRLMHDLPSTALFAAHFRMNAARSLVLGRSSPRRRIPLWLQRIKAGDLLSLARQEPDFPVALETFRECLHDVLDVPGFVELQEELAAGTVRLEYRHSAVPSPFARTFILQLTAASMYSDDTPRAEKKAQFLALDRDLLQEMLGEEGLRSLLEPEAIAATVERRQRLAGALSARSADELEEVLLDVGELAAEEVAKRVSEPGALGSLLAGGRAVARSLASPPVTRYLAAEEEALYIDAYGPAGAKQHMARGFLLKRYARTHGPFRTGEPAARYGWPVEEVEPVLDELRRQGWLAKGAFLPGGSGAEWCHRDVLEEVHRRTLSVLRREVEAVAPADYARFLLQWQGVAGPGPAEDSPDGLAQVLDQLAGLFLPVEVWERDVLRSRLPTFGPAWLDLLCARGEFTWILQPGGRHGRLGFLRRADVQRVLPLFLGSEAAPLSPEAQAVEAFLRQRGAAFVSELISPEAGIGSGTVVQDALWELALAGRVSNDTFEPVRRGRPHVGGFVESGHSRSGQRETRPDLRRAIRQRVAAAMNAGGGRWAVLPGASSGSPPEESAPGRESLERLADMLLERWGVVCRDMLVAEGLERHWPALHRVLQVFGMTGRARSGYFVTTLGGPQFAHPRAVEALREARGQGKEEHQLQLLSSCDPALTMGPLFPAGLPSGASFSRSSLNYAVVCQGRLILYVGGFGRSLWSPDDADGEALSQALLLLPRLLAVPGHQRPRRSLTVATLNGRPVAETSAGATLEQAGFEASADVWVLWPSRVQG
jgi:ATP-dependent Lhr-like helicase